MHKIGMKEFVGMLEKERALCKETLSICREAIEESLEPRSVWLQEKEKIKKRINEIDRSLEVLKKYVC